MYLSKIYSYRAVPVQPGNAWVEGNQSVLRSAWMDLCQKLNNNNKYRGIPSIPVIFRGVSRKILFLLWSIYDHMFSWTPCSENMKFGKLGEKTRVSKYYSQIPDYEPLSLLIFYVLIWRFISHVRFLFQCCSLVTRKGANPLFFWLSCSFHAHLGHTYKITWSKWPALRIDHGT